MKKIKDKKTFFILIAVLVAVVIVFTWKFADKYRQSNTFNFDDVSPQGYFSDLKTSSPEESPSPA